MLYAPYISLLRYQFSGVNSRSLGAASAKMVVLFEVDADRFLAHLPNDICQFGGRARIHFSMHPFAKLPQYGDLTWPMDFRFWKL